MCVGVRVSPSSSRVEVRGPYGERLKVALSAPPEDNRANHQLEEVLAEWLDVGREQVGVQAGHASRDKVVAFTGIDQAELRTRLERLLRERQERTGAR
ncbi:MAG: hypothetical protein A2W26_06695 [Acidobacteria bacterium RBG_16_64_8]|nr:MAG: hypothetical protein A2W26_06695 [Acidobacteria bacterium RBG_16_64_8]